MIPVVTRKLENAAPSFSKWFALKNHVSEEARISDLEKRKTKNDTTLKTKLIYFTQKAMRFWATEFKL